MSPFFIIGLLLFFLKSVKGTFLLGLVAFGIMTYFQLNKKPLQKTILSSETFMRHDEDIIDCIVMLKKNNTYRTDINEEVEKNMRLFFSTYFGLFYKWDDNKYSVLLDIEDKILSLVRSLEFERDDIQYKKTFETIARACLKYKTILSNKYDFDIDAPKPRDILNK